MKKEELRKEAIKILLDGGTIEEASQNTGLEYDYIRFTVYNNLSHYKRYEENKAKVLDLINKGLTRDEITDSLGICKSTLEKISKELGVKPKRKKWTKHKERKPRVSKLDHEAMKAYKAEGHTNKEVSERFCCSYEYTMQICKGIAPQKNQYGDYCQREQRAIEMIQSRAPDYEYVGGFKGSEDDVILKCKHCGDVVKRSMASVRHRKLKCQRCDDIKRNAEQERKRQERKAEQAERERLKRIEKYKNTKRIQVQAQSCSICGGLFVPKTSLSKTCSKECRNKLMNRRKDKRISKDKTIDKDITLEKLYIRDDGVCKLCGGLCDWNDEPNKKDSKYPSIDHIIPISDGGEHSWDNVQLAHWYCNILRGNAPLSETFKQI